MADTGVDWDNCFFHDPRFPLAPPLNAVNHTHRKIVAYFVGTRNACVFMRVHVCAWIRMHALAHCVRMHAFVCICKLFV